MNSVLKTVLALVALFGAAAMEPPCSTAQDATTFHVSTDGSDAGPGTIDQPFASLERARDAIRSMNEKLQSGRPVTVWIHGGTYRLHQSFRLGNEDSGSEQAPIVYRAFGNDEVHLVGGMTLPVVAARTLDEVDTRLKARLPYSSRGNVYVYHLRELGITDFGEMRQFGHGQPVFPAPIELFVDTKPMTLARYPNEGSMLIGDVIDPGSIPRVGDYSNRGGVFKYADERHSRWVDADDAWLQGTFMWGYADDMIPVAAIDTVAHTVKLGAPHMYGIGTGTAYRQYYALNLIEELDTPGEWYLDRTEGVLYFYPPGPIHTLDIEISMLTDPMIRLEGVSHVTIRDLTIEYGRGMGIYIEGGSHNTIAGCTIRNLGTIGILMGQGAEQTVAGITHEDYEGRPASGIIGSLQTHRYHNTTWDRNAGHDHVIRSNDVYDTGAGGILIGGGDRLTLEPGNTVAENNRTFRNQRRNKFLWSGIIVDGVGNKVSHNEIFDSDYQGIMVNGNDHVFEYNHIHDIGMDSDDTSPWYTGRDPSGRGNIVRYNYFHDIGRPDRMGMGVYLDDGTCGTFVYGNVFDRVASYGTVYSNAGSDNVVENNIFLNGFGPAFHIKSMWFTWAIPHIHTYWDEGGIYPLRLRHAVDITRPPYSTRYPELVDFLEPRADGKTWKGMIPSRNVFRRNLVVNYEEVLRLDYPNIEIDVEDNWSTHGDPGFLDMAAADYGLVDTAEVFRQIPNFERIPFEQIGIYRDEYRTRRDAPKRNH